jgi:hypothetical protein
MARFYGIPAVSYENTDPLTSRVLSALKENVELLTGQRGEADLDSIAITRGQITAPYADAEFTGLTAKGAGLRMTEGSVPDFADYVKLLQDVQLLAYDVAVLRNTVNILLAQLRSEQ